MKSQHFFCISLHCPPPSSVSEGKSREIKQLQNTASQYLWMDNVLAVTEDSFETNNKSIFSVEEHKAHRGKTF